MHPIVILFLAIAAAVARIFTSYESLNFLMSVVNTVALLIVSLSIMVKTENLLCFKIDNGQRAAFSGHIKKKFHVFYIIASTVLIALSVLYIIRFYNAVVNDIISIVSLLLSILTDDISNLIVRIFYRQKR